MSEVDTATQVAMHIKLQEDTKDFIKHVLHELLQDETVLFNTATMDNMAQRFDGNYAFQKAVRNAMLTQLNKY